jgi:hypothetical protein
MRSALTPDTGLSADGPCNPPVGVRRAGGDPVGELDPAKLVGAWVRVSSRIVKHGFAIEYRDLEPPRTGIFDGLKIVIDPDVGFEMQLFILLHLFGHSVQWVAPSLENDLDELRHTTDQERFWKALHDYEFQAARFGLRLLHEAGVDELDAWYADFVATDWRYVETYYRTGRIPEWPTCVERGAAPIEPAEIPPLTLRQVEVRFAF